MEIRKLYARDAVIAGENPTENDMKNKLKYQKKNPTGLKKRRPDYYYYKHTQRKYTDINNPPVSTARYVLKPIIFRLYTTIVCFSITEFQYYIIIFFRVRRLL